MVNNLIMKILIIVVTILLLNKTANAFNPPPAPIPPYNNIVDLDNKLSSDELRKLDIKINAINRKSKNEIAILIIHSLEGETISDVSHITFNNWKIGKSGLDNGILIVISVVDRRSRIEIGKGIEGEITDLQSNDILKNNLNPHLKGGDFYGGLLETINIISKTIENKNGKINSSAHKNNQPVGVASCSTLTIGYSDGGNNMILFFIVFAVICFIIMIWRAFKSTNNILINSNPNRYYNSSPANINTSYKNNKLSIPSASIDTLHKMNYSSSKEYTSTSFYNKKRSDDDEISFSVDTAVIALTPVVIPIISSCNDEEEDDNKNKLSYSNSDYSYSSSYDSSDSGFGGGESGGGGSDSTWDE